MLLMHDQEMLGQMQGQIRVGFGYRHLEVSVQYNSRSKAALADLHILKRKDHNELSQVYCTRGRH